MRWEQIKFVSFNDFYKNRKIIRHYYKELPLDDKWSYKRFIYSDELKEKEIDKDCIWNYLNEIEFSKKELTVRFKKRTYDKKRELIKNTICNDMLDFMSER